NLKLAISTKYSRLVIIIFSFYLLLILLVGGFPLSCFYYIIFFFVCQALLDKLFENFYLLLDISSEGTRLCCFQILRHSIMDIRYPFFGNSILETRISGKVNSCTKCAEGESFNSFFNLFLSLEIHQKDLRFNFCILQRRVCLLEVIVIINVAKNLLRTSF